MKRKTSKMSRERKRQRCLLDKEKVGGQNLLAHPLPFNFPSEWMRNTKLSVNQTWQQQDQISKHWVKTYRSDFLLNILPPSADSAQISVKHAMMSLARPLVVSACAETPRYQLLAITWLLISLLPQPLQDFRKAFSVLDFFPFLTLTLSEQSEFGDGVRWALSVRDCQISSPYFLSFFPHQNKRIRHLYP